MRGRGWLVNIRYASYPKSYYHFAPLRIVMRIYDTDRCVLDPPAATPWLASAIAGPSPIIQPAPTYLPPAYHPYPLPASPLTHPPIIPYNGLTYGCASLALTAAPRRGRIRWGEGINHPALACYGSKGRLMGGLCVCAHPHLPPP